MRRRRTPCPVSGTRCGICAWVSGWPGLAGRVDVPSGWTCLRLRDLSPPGLTVPCLPDASLAPLRCLSTEGKRGVKHNVQYLYRTKPYKLHHLLTSRSVKCMLFRCWASMMQTPPKTNTYSIWESPKTMHIRYCCIWHCTYAAMLLCTTLHIKKSKYGALKVLSNELEV